MFAQTVSERAAVGDRSIRRLLIAEDCEITREFLKLVLKERGYSVDMAADGEEALAALKARDYDVVLMDFHLPKMDGLAVTATYRSGKRGRQPRFVAITSDVKGLMAHSETADHFDRVVPKPFDVAQLCRLIEG